MELRTVEGWNDSWKDQPRSVQTWGSLGHLGQIAPLDSSAIRK
jgi:hypothetical protein